MSLSIARNRPHVGFRSPRGAALAAGLLAALLATGAAQADVAVVLDQAKVVRMPRDVAMVVIGNPAVADITVQKSTGIVILTGKTYGATNMIMLDANGHTLSDQQVVVRSGGDRIVTVQRGAERESLACRPTCERTITIGDGPSFDTASQQLTQHNGLASGQTVNPGVSSLASVNPALVGAALASAGLGSMQGVVPGVGLPAIPGAALSGAVGKPAR